MKTVDVIKLDKRTEYLHNDMPVFYIEPPAPSMPVSVSDDAITMSVKYETYRAEIHTVNEKGKKRRNIVLDRDAQELVDMFVVIERKKLIDIYDLELSSKRHVIDDLQQAILWMKRPWYVRLASFLRG